MTPCDENGERATRALSDAIYARAFALFEEERYRDAAVVFRAMMQAFPTDERAWLGLGQCHEQLGQEVIALELYSAGTIAADPALRCMLSRFRILYDRNQLLDAEAAFDAALAIAGTLADEASNALVARERRARP